MPIIAWMFLLSPLWLVMLWTLYVAEEDWRGQHMWAETKAEFERKGETFDYAALVPPPVPDDKNLGALPLFRLERDPADKGAIKPLALNHALENIHSSSGDDDYRLPVASRMMKGQLADVDAIAKNISKRYREIFKPAANTPEPSTIQELEALCPVMGEVRDAAKTHPLCRLPQNYTSMPPYNRPLGLSTKMISLAQVFTLHAILELHAHRSDVALEDMNAVFLIDSDLRKEPVLVPGLVAVGVEAIQEQAIWEGLALHEWNDAQLVELENSLKGIEFFSNYQVCIRGEALGFFVPMMDIEEAHLSISDIFGMSNPENDESQAIEMKIAGIVMWFTPRGWFPMTKTRAVTLYLNAADKCVNLSSHRFYPERSDELAEESRKSYLLTPAEILRRVSMGPILNSCSAFAQGQFQIDAAGLACRAERYRFAHGAYPDSLAALADGDIPRDIVNGEPYNYVHQPSGAFFNYSVGWDLKDDGGKRALKPGSQSADREHGDWLWPALATP